LHPRAQQRCAINANNRVEAGDGHGSEHLRHESITVAMTSKASLEKPQQIGQIGKRCAIAQCTRLALDAHSTRQSERSAAGLHC